MRDRRVADMPADALRVDFGIPQDRRIGERRAPRPAPTICPTCGAVAAEIVCHICKTPKGVSSEYRPPVERVCPSCGRKHTGAFSLCSHCASLVA